MQDPARYGADLASAGPSAMAAFLIEEESFRE